MTNNKSVLVPESNSHRVRLEVRLMCSPDQLLFGESTGMKTKAIEDKVILLTQENQRQTLITDYFNQVAPRCVHDAESTIVPPYTSDSD